MENGGKGESTDLYCSSSARSTRNFRRRGEKACSLVVVLGLGFEDEDWRTGWAAEALMGELLLRARGSVWRMTIISWIRVS